MTVVAAQQSQDSGLNGVALVVLYELGFVGVLLAIGIGIGLIMKTCELLEARFNRLNPRLCERYPRYAQFDEWLNRPMSAWARLSASAITMAACLGFAYAAHALFKVPFPP